jgi:hypothetical protein
MVAKGERWPPVYDAEDLVNEIRQLTEGENLEREFFEWRLDRSTTSPTDICQGDIVVLKSDVPVILEDGQPATLEHPESTWMVIGNSCDFDRSIDEARWTQLVPIAEVGTLAEVTQAQLSAARRYTQSRKFYVPPWSAHAEQHLHIADLLLPVAVDKRAFQYRHVTLQARVSRAAWILLNACLVRFLARDDGRYDLGGV